MKRLEEDLKRIVTSNDINSMVRLHASEAIQCLKVSDRVNNKLFHYGSEGKIELFRVSYGIKGGIPGVMRGYEFLFYATEIAPLNKEFNLQENFIDNVVSRRYYEYNNVRKLLREKYNDEDPWDLFYLDGEVVDDFNWRLYNLCFNSEIPKQMFLENEECLYYIKDFVSQVNPEYLEFRKGEYITYGDLLKAGVTHDFLYENLRHTVEGLTRNEFIRFITRLGDSPIQKGLRIAMREFLLDEYM